MTFDPHNAKIFQCPKCGARNRTTPTRNDSGEARLCKGCRTLYSIKEFEANFLPDGQHPPQQPKAPDVPLPSEAHARADDPDTARSAAEAVSGKRANELESKVVETLAAKGPLTVWQIAKTANIGEWSISPRMKPLEKKGLVRRLGKRIVPGRRESILWEVVA